jgi:PQQ-dependent dehydrogenase (methanol/ethanol family)
MALGAAGTLLATTAVAQQAPAGARQPTFTSVTRDMLHNARNDGGRNWLMYGRDYTNQRWSPLTQINTGNVQNLRVSWIYQTGISRLGSFENTPVVVDGVMYVTTPYNVAMAVDARTGKELWRYEHKLGTQIYCCGPNNRGVAVADTNVYMATLDSRLVSLNARTGKVNWDIEIEDPEAGYSQTMAPLVVDNMVIVGTSGAEYGIRGFVRAYNKDNGQRIWNWYTIPAPGEGPNGGGWEGSFSAATPEGDNLNRNIAQERADMSKYSDAWQRGGGSMWMTPAYDAETRTLFLAIGNPSPDLDGSVRPGDNLYTESIVALDGTNGRLKWYYQQVPHDVWDLDATSPPVIVRLRNGKKAVAEAGKTAWVYVLDAETGKLIRKSEPFNRQENMFAQPTAQGTRMLPGANGGAEWSPVSVNPNLGYAYVAGLEQPMHYITHSAPYEKGKLWLGSAFKAIPGERQYGTFTAIDLNTGKKAWQVETPQPMMGGSVATAGNLVFTGHGDGKFAAYDARNGRELWSFQGGAGCNAAPATYMVDNTQYIAVACGGNFQLGYPLGDAVIVFSLPRGQSAPAR